jgi:hypothetical protein
MPDLKSPMCEKLSAVADQRMTLTSFLDWLADQNLELCTSHTHSKGCEAPHEHDHDCRKRRDGVWVNSLLDAPCPKMNRVCGYHEDEYTPTHEKADRLILRFLEIDEKQLEAERRAILESLR